MSYLNYQRNFYSHPKTQTEVFHNLCAFCEFGELERFKSLITEHKNPGRNNWKLLAMAVEHGHLPIASFLLSNYNIDLEKQPSQCSPHPEWEGRTFLQRAINLNRCEIVKLLIEKGAKININHFHQAAHIGRKNLLEIIMNHVPDIPRVYSDTSWMGNFNPLSLAKDMETFEWLLDQGFILCAANFTQMINCGRVRGEEKLDVSHIPSELLIRAISSDAQNILPMIINYDFDLLNSKFSHLFMGNRFGMFNNNT